MKKYKRVMSVAPSPDALREARTEAYETKCPFCGVSEAIWWVPDYPAIGPLLEKRYQLICSRCGARGPVCSTEWLALKTWIERKGLEAADPQGREPGMPLSGVE